MALSDDLRLLLHITGSAEIARRYFVTNGFDGTLAMLGLLTGFRTANQASVAITLAACLGAAVALGVSGIASAYISEAAERRKELDDLRESMLHGMDGSAHALAARWVPVWIALVNGLAPFLLAQMAMLPLWLVHFGVDLPLQPLDAAIAICFLLIFLIGIFLGRLGRTHWLLAGLRTVAIGGATALIILLVDL